MLRSMLVILVVCSAFLSGCGTFSDTMYGPVDDRVFYRGVRLDVQAVKEGGSHVLLIGDIPFSAVADTLSVPVGVIRVLTDPPQKITMPTASTQ